MYQPNLLKSIMFHQFILNYTRLKDDTLSFSRNKNSWALRRRASGGGLIKRKGDFH